MGQANPWRYWYDTVAWEPWNLIYFLYFVYFSGVVLSVASSSPFESGNPSFPLVGADAPGPCGRILLVTSARGMNGCFSSPLRVDFRRPEYLSLLTSWHPLKLTPFSCLCFLSWLPTSSDVGSTLSTIHASSFLFYKGWVPDFQGCLLVELEEEWL